MQSATTLYENEIPQDETNTLPEIPTLNNLESLLTPPEQLNSDIKKMITEATKEVTTLLKSPLTATQRTLASPNLNPAVRQEFVDGYVEGAEALKFLNAFCQSFHQEGFPMNGIEIGVEIEEAGGYKINVQSLNQKQYLGKIGDTYISNAEIIIRTGESQTSSDYTPMQLNFRFENNGREVTSLRVDMHNRTAKEVQVDANVGNEKTKRIHQTVHAFSQNGSPAQNFRDFQHMFLLNIIEQLIAEEVTDEGIVLKPNIHIEDAAHNIVNKKLVKAYKKAQRALGLNNNGVSEADFETNLQAGEENAVAETNALSRLTEVIEDNVVVSDTFKNTFREKFGADENGSVNVSELIANWILGKNQHGVEEASTEIVEYAIAELSNFESVQNIRMLETQLGMETETQMLELEDALIQNNGTEEDLRVLEKLYAVRRLLQMSF